MSAERQVYSGTGTFARFLCSGMVIAKEEVERFLLNDVVTSWRSKK
jgi:hypothetical protein